VTAARLRGDRRRRPGAHALCRPDHPQVVPAGRAPAQLPVEAILRVYNRHGRRDNIYKARIKILVAALGAEEFARQVEEEWGKIDHARANLPASELARVRAAFAQTRFETLPAVSDAFEAARAASPALQRFVRNNVKPHKQPGYAIVEVSLKAIGQTPGDATAEQLDVVADLAERYSLDDLRVTHAQNLVLPHVKLDDLPAVHAVLARRAWPPPISTWPATSSPARAWTTAPWPTPAPSRSPRTSPQVRRRGPGREGGRAEDQDQRLHQRLRPPPRGPHRHPGRR
jgi:hypothetical protein